MLAQESSTSNSRWWENYVVRYFVGTVVGAGVVVFLNEYCASPFKEILGPELKSISLKEVAILASIGFAFCYVASAPVLAAHGTRYYLRASEIRKKWIAWILVPLVASLASWYLLSSEKAYSVVGAVIFGLVVGAQIVLVATALLNRLQDVSGFYWKLSTARSKGAPEVAEYVESYRHLREHGNAFSILIAELLLCLILVILPNKFFAIPVLLIWMLPSSLVWLIGTILESKLADAPHSP